MNSILRDVMPEFAKELNKRVHDKSTREKYLASLPEKKRLEFKEELIEPLLKNNIKVSSKNGALFTQLDGKLIKLELVDFISQKYKVNGVSFVIDPYKSLDENLQNIAHKLEKVVSIEKPRSLIEKVLFIQEAHALAFMVPIMVGSLAISAATLMYDSVSGYYNNINNGLNGANEKIKELIASYKERANKCESDLTVIRSSSSKNNITGNSSVVALARLVEGLDAELEDKMFDFSGKSEIDFDGLGCEAYNSERDGIFTGSVFGIWEGVVDVNGSIVTPLCDEQERLNDCLKDVNEVVNDKEISINDIPRHDPRGVYEGLVDQYRVLNGNSNVLTR